MERNSKNHSISSSERPTWLLPLWNIFFLYQCKSKCRHNKNKQQITNMFSEFWSIWKWLRRLNHVKMLVGWKLMVVNRKAVASHLIHLLLFLFSLIKFTESLNDNNEIAESSQMINDFDVSIAHHFFFLAFGLLSFLSKSWFQLCDVFCHRLFCSHVSFSTHFITQLA